MIKVEIGGKTVELYDSIEELPIVRFQKYNKYLLLDACVGSDLNDLSGRIDKAIRYVGIDPQSAITELRNLQIGIALIGEELSPKHMAFAALVHSIQGKPIGTSDDAFKDALKSLNKGSNNLINRLLESIKKKIDEQLEAYFPSVNSSGMERQTFDLIKKRALIQLDSLIDKKDRSKDIFKLESELLLLNKPKQFNSDLNTEVEYDKEFNRSILLIQDSINADGHLMSVMQFYNALDYIRIKNKPQKDGSTRRSN